MAKCKKCGADIVFVKSAKSGKWLPCDPPLIEYREGHTDNYDEKFVTQDGRVVQCSTDFLGQPDGEARKPHWVTCPYADDFRNR